MTPPARKIALFNDTSPERHFGCEAVMAAIDANITARGGHIIYRHPVLKPWESERAALATIEEADLVLVNGEGTIHHSKRTAAALARLGPHCRARNKPCFLINATIQANNHAVMSDVAAFDAVWVREGRSAAEARSWGIAAERCGDLSFFHVFPRHDGGGDRGIVLDSADRATREKMARIAETLKTEFAAMRHTRRGLKVYRKHWLRWRYETDNPNTTIAGIDTFQQFAAFLAQRRFLITGRFHGMCFAINSRVPVLAMPLDVWKSDAVLSDIGLGSARLYQPGRTPQPFTQRELELIAAYIADIRRRIAAMFDCILPARQRSELALAAL